MILLISYDLSKPSQDYGGLYKVLQSADRWWHYLESTWLISTTESAEAWSHKLRSHLDQNDRILIIEVKRNWWAFLPQKAIDWIQNNLFP